MKLRWLPLLVLALPTVSPSPASGQCEPPATNVGLQWGLGIQSFFPGNQPDFNLLSPGYLLTSGYRWGSSGVYGTVQYASSTGFSLFSFEGSFRQLLETPFLNFFGQVGAYYMSYGLPTASRHNSVGGLLGAGLLIQLSPGIEFTAHFKGYIEAQALTAAGGTFLFSF